MEVPEKFQSFLDQRDARVQALGIEGQPVNIQPAYRDLDQLHNERR